MKRLLAVGAICALGAAILAGLTPLVFGTPQPMVRVTWRAIDPGERRALERQFRLSEPSPIAGTTWAYVPLDVTDRTVRAIVTHPAVADTDGIDRRAMTMARRPPLTPRRGGLWTGAPAWGARVTRLAAAALGLLGAGALLLGMAAYAGVTPRSALTFARAGRALPARAAHLSLPSPVVVALIVAAVVAFRLLTLDYFENDHFTYLTFAHQMMLGDLPVRDFDDPGFPLMLALSAAAMWVGGINLLPEALLTASMLGIAACVTSRAAWLATGNRWLAWLAAILQVMAYPRLYGYPKIVIPACAVLLFFEYRRRPSLATLAWLAGLTELGLLLRHDLAVYVSVAATALIFIVHGATRVAVRRIALYGALCAALTIPYAAYLFVFGVEAHFASAVGFSRSEAARTGDLSSLLASGSPLAFAMMALPVAAWLWLIIRRSRSGRWDGDGAPVAATALLLAMINAALLRDTTPSRVADVYGAAPILIAWIAAEALRAAGRARSRAARLAGAAAVAAVVGALVVGTASVGQLPHQLAEARVPEGWREMSSHARRQLSLLREWPWTGMSQGTALEPLVRYLDACTAPDQPVLILGYLPALPFFARRPFAGGHSWLQPGYFTSASDQGRMATRLAESPPAVVVIEPADDVDITGRQWPAIARVLPEYREPQPFARWYVRTARRLPVRGVDAETGLPCLR